MAFIVEDGTGLPNATAYIDVATFDAYWADVGVVLTETNALKQAAIVEATRYMEQRYKRRYRGYIVKSDDPAQVLSWPRQQVYDYRGILLASDEVPAGIENACAEYTRRALATPESLLPDPTGDPLIIETTEIVGPIEETVKRVPGLTITKPYPTADAIIAEFLICPGGVIR